MNMAPDRLINFALAPAGTTLPEDAGFKRGAKGTHSSRTLMLNDLVTALAAAPENARHDDYVNAIVAANCLGKSTASTRRLSAQRLSELYALDAEVPIFRVFRHLWQQAGGSRRLLALLLAVGRDPLLAATAPPVLALPSGADLQRDTVRDAVQRVAGDRFNPAILDKVVRNTASSWTQAGHLEGRTFKKRCVVKPSIYDAAYALYLAQLAGFRGLAMFGSGWFKLLDCSPDRAEGLATEAKRAGLVDLRISGDVVDLNLDKLDPWLTQEKHRVAP